MNRFVPLLFVIMVSGCATSTERPPAPEARFPSAVVVVPDSVESGKVQDMSLVVTPMRRVEEGVYFFRNVFSTLILELAGGRYRYWFSTDVSGPEPTYPRTGRYVVDGVIVRLQYWSRRRNTQAGRCGSTRCTPRPLG
jgi:hypothetical protein